MTTEKKAFTPLQKGLIISLLLIGTSLLVQFFVTDLQQQQKFSWVSFGLLIAGIIWACWSYSSEMNKNVTFGNLFAHGFKTTAVVTCILVVFTILSVAVLFPEMRQKAMEAAAKQMEEQGKMTDTQIEQAVAFTDKFFMPLAIGGALIGNLIVGALAALLGAAIAPKNPNPTPFASDNLS